MAIAAETVFSSSKVFCQDLPTIFAEYLNERMRESAPIAILVTGKEGAGRSALINALLGFTKVPERNKLAGAKTTQVKEYKNLVGVVQVTAWDTPGLRTVAPGEKSPLYTENMKRCSADVDLILLCVDMCVVRYNEADYLKPLNEFIRCLGEGAFEKTMIVLTFANKYIVQIEHDYSRNLEGKKRNFGKMVEKWEERLKSTLQNECEVDEEVVNKIKVVPAGSRQNPHLFEEDPTWLSKLWLEAITVNPHITPSVAKLYNHQLSGPQRTSVSFTLQLREDFSIRHQVSSEQDNVDMEH